MASNASEAKRRAVAKASTEATRKAAQSKKFGAADIAKGLANPYIQGAAQGSDIAGGQAIAGSVKNVASGKGNVGDALNIGLAATALGGIPAGKIASVASKALANKAFSSAVKNPSVAARIPASRLPEIVNSGGLKNVFDASRAAGWGAGDDAAAYLNQRKFVENQAFGIPETATAAQRPIYGYLYKPGLPVLPGNSELANTSKILSRNNPGAAGYGDLTAVVKNVPKGSTYTVGDSFRSWTGGRAEQLGADVTKSMPSLKGMTNKQVSYVEAQLPQSAGTIDNLKLLAPDIASMKATKDWLKLNDIKIPVGLNVQEVLANPGTNLKQLKNIVGAKKAELLRNFNRSPQAQVLRSAFGNKAPAGVDPFAVPADPFSPFR